MLTKLSRLLRQLSNKSRIVNNTPLNRVSLIVLILIDIFILVNVFMGLNDIGQWYLSPEQAYPCHSQWNNYANSNNKEKDYETLSQSLNINSNNYQNLTSETVQKRYQRIDEEHLGSVSAICMTYASYEDRINTSTNKKIAKIIDEKQREINTLQEKNKTIRAQYDSTLLEQLAGQARSQSINRTGAFQAKQELDKNTQQISNLNGDRAKLKTELITNPESRQFLKFLQDETTLQKLNSSYERSSFWYPSIQLVFQFFFLCPLIIIAFCIHSLALKKDYGLVALISWHLLVIFFIPLIIKLLEFLQFGVLATLIFEFVSALLGGLLFLVSYVYILAIPLIGFGIIKLFQQFSFNIKLQTANRVQKSRCIKCAKKLRSDDSYCPHCGYYQYMECPNCHNQTYKYLPHCHQCGARQDVSQL